ESALKARDAAAAEAAQRKADEDARIAEAVKAERARWEQEAVKGRRLPDGSYDGAAQIAQFGDLAKYDDLELADIGLMTSILGDARRRGMSRYGASENAIKAFAVRLADSDEANRDTTGVVQRGRG